mgnify:CR=1 FL=1
MVQPDEREDALRKMLQLPPDWWQSIHTASILLKWFKSHIIPLLVAGSVGKNIQYNVYTGILLEHNQIMVWLTAGHVVDELKQLLSSSAFKPSVMTWLDGYEAPMAEGVRLHRTDIPMKSWRTDGLDVGAIIPSILDIGNILKNDKVIPINAQIWKNLRQANPEGYYAIGFPRPWSEHSQKPGPNQKILHSVKADLACLPLTEIPPPPEFADDPKWSDPAAFYGKIIPFIDDPKFEVNDVKGMSGGPILSVERDSDGRILYRLVGVIQSWAAAQSIIRAEPIHRVSQAIDKWLEEQQSTTAQQSVRRR